MAADLREDGGQLLPTRGQLPAPLVRLVRAGWPVLWIAMMATGHWQVGLVLLLLTGPVMVAVLGTRRERRQRRRAERDRRRRELSRRVWTHDGVPGRDGATWHRAPAPVAATVGVPAAERSLAATLVRAEASAARLDPAALVLVRELEQLLRPLLASVRTRGADARVRHDLEAVATDHLPAALESYLVLPADYAREHRTAAGTTPADELHSQLLLLVEGCRQLRDAVHDADLDRQQQLSRFLEAKFRRSDLDL